MSLRKQLGKIQAFAAYSARRSIVMIASLVDTLAALTIALWAPLSLLPFIVRRLLHRRSISPPSGHILLLSGALLIPLPAQLLAGRSGFELLGQAALLALLLWLLEPVRQPTIRGILAALMLSLALIVPFQLRTNSIWLDGLQTPPLGMLIRGESDLNARPFARAVFKTWQIDPKTEIVRLQFDARLAEDPQGLDWLASGTDLPLLTMSDTRDECLETIGLPALAQRFSNEERDARGSCFRRKPTFVATSEDTIPDLKTSQTIRGAHYRYSFEETVGSQECLEVSGYTFVDTGDAGRAYSSDVRRVNLVAGARLPTYSSNDTSITVRPSIPGFRSEADNMLRFVPRPAWTSQVLELHLKKLPERANEDLLTLAMVLDAGTSIMLRNIELRSLTPHTTPPRPKSYPRVSLWFPQPNLAGHTWATIGLAVASIGFSVPTLFASAFLTVPLVVLSGSRIALASLLLGLSSFFWMVSRRRWQRASLVALGILSLALISSWSPLSLGRFQVSAVENEVSRQEIWTQALKTMYEHPYAGLGRDEFSKTWRTDSSTPRSGLPTHAHNIWLQYAIKYGVPGLVSILTLTGGLILLAWRWAKGRGLALIIPILLMNFFDSTLFYAGVIYPLVLGLNGLRCARRPNSRGSADPIAPA